MERLIGGSAVSQIRMAKAVRDSFFLLIAASFLSG